MSFLCSSDEEHRSSSGGSGEFPSDISGAPVKFHRERKKQVHNEVERRRKDKLSTWILKIGELLPAQDTHKKCKNGILERTVEYINYLKAANEKLLDGGFKDVQAEELRRLRQQVRHLEAQSKIYLRLLRKAGIHPISPMESHMWSQQPKKYPKHFTPEQASALLQVQQSKGNSPSNCVSRASKVDQLPEAVVSSTGMSKSVTPTSGSNAPNKSSANKPEARHCVTSVQNTQVVSSSQTLVTQALPAEPLMSTTTQNFGQTVQKEVESHHNPPTLTAEASFAPDTLSGQSVIVLSNEQGLNMVAFQNKSVLVPNRVSVGPPKSTPSPTSMVLQGGSKVLMSNGLMTIRPPQDERIISELNQSALCQQAVADGLNTSLSMCDTMPGSQGLPPGALQSAVMPFTMSHSALSFSQQGQVTFNQQGQVAFNQQGQMAFNQQGQVITFGPGTLLTGQQSWPGSLPSALLLPNGQIIPVVSQPSVMYTNSAPINNMNNGLMLATPTITTRNCTVPGNEVSNSTLVIPSKGISSSQIVESSKCPTPVSNLNSVTSNHCSNHCQSNNTAISRTTNVPKRDKSNGVSSRTAVCHNSKNTKKTVMPPKPKAENSNSKCKAQRTIRPKSTPPNMNLTSSSSQNTQPSMSPAQKNLSNNFEQNTSGTPQPTTTSQQNQNTNTQQQQKINTSQHMLSTTQNILTTTQSLTNTTAKDCVTPKIINTVPSQTMTNTTNSTPTITSDKNLSVHPQAAAVAEKPHADSSPEASATDILAKATESIFSCSLPELSPPGPDFSQTDSHGPVPAAMKTNQLAKPCEPSFSSPSMNNHSGSRISSSASASPILHTNYGEKDTAISNKRSPDSPKGLAQIGLSKEFEPPEKRPKRIDILTTTAEASPPTQTPTPARTPPERQHTEKNPSVVPEPFSSEMAPSQAIDNRSPQHFQGGNLPQMLHQNSSEPPSSSPAHSNSCHTPANSLPTGVVSGVDAHDIGSFVSGPDNSDHELPALILSSLGEDSDAPSSVNSSSNSGLQFLALSPPEQFGTELANAKEPIEHSTFNLMGNQAPYCSESYTCQKEVCPRQQNGVQPSPHFTTQNKSNTQPLSQSTPTLELKQHQNSQPQQQANHQHQQNGQQQNHHSQQQQHNHQQPQGHHQQQVLSHLPGNSPFLCSSMKKSDSTTASQPSSNATITSITSSIQHHNQQGITHPHLSSQINFMSNPLPPPLLGRSYLPHENMVTTSHHPGTSTSNFLLPVPPPTGPFDPAKEPSHHPPSHMTIQSSAQCSQNQRQSPFAHERNPVTKGSSHMPPRTSASIPTSRHLIPQASSNIDNVSFSQCPPTHTTTSNISSNNNVTLSNYSTEALLGHQTPSSLVGSFPGINSIHYSSQSTAPSSCSRTARSLLPYSAESLLQNQPYIEKKNHHHHPPPPNVISGTHSYGQSFPKLPPSSSAQPFFASEAPCLPCSSLGNTVVSHTPSFSHNVPSQHISTTNPHSHHHHFNNTLLMTPFQDPPTLRNNTAPPVGPFSQSYSTFGLTNSNGSFQNRGDTLNCLQSGSVDTGQQMQIPQQPQQQNQQQGCLFPPVSHGATGMQQAAGPLLQLPDHSGFPPLIPSLNDGESNKVPSRPVLNHFPQPPPAPPPQNHFFTNPFVTGINGRNCIPNHSFLDNHNKSKDSNTRSNASSRSPQPSSKTSLKSKSKKSKQVDGYIDKGASYFPVPELSNERFFSSPRGPAPQNLLPPPPMPLSNSRQVTNTSPQNTNYSQAPLFRPQSQLNFQSFPSLPTTRGTAGNQINVSTSSANIVPTGPGHMGGHVPNFNLSNIFPDISTAAGDSLTLSPIKFPPPNPILPSNGHATDVSAGPATASARSSLYPGSRLPNSFNGILSTGAVSFDRSPMAGIHQNFGPSSAHPPPTFGNVIPPPLNFPVHEH